MDEELLIEFKRFPQEKQEQIRSLVNYAILMGLTGKDLISIGGKLNRIAEKEEVTRNLKILESMDKDIVTIGQDRDCRRRWNYYHHGQRFQFVADWVDVKIKNPRTGVTRDFYIDEKYKFGRRSHRGSRVLPQVMLDIFYGNIVLNF